MAPGHVAVYRELYAVYKILHDAFGLSGAVPVTCMMKELR